ncbi:MAG: ribosomal protein S18-alanine N-acetyltransferase [Pseudomonadota bacterium]
MTADELAAIHAAAFVQDRPWTAQEFRDLAANPLVHLETVQHGFALWRAVADEAELLTIAVAPEAQGRGYGAALMTAWMAKAARTCNRAFLEVASDNARALRLYTSQGFEIVAKRKAYYRRPKGQADALVMEARAPFSVSRKSSGGSRP